MEKIGEGSGREVFNYSKGHVIKIPKNKSGLMQNQKELEVYERFKDSPFGSLLAPCSLTEREDVSGVLMTRAETWTEEEVEELEQEFTLFELFEEYGADDFLLKKMIDSLEQEGLVTEDLLGLSSWGVIDGSLALIDYGCTYDILRELKYN